MCVNVPYGEVRANTPQCTCIAVGNTLCGQGVITWRPCSRRDVGVRWLGGVHMDIPFALACSMSICTFFLHGLYLGEDLGERHES
jgi:hypothetical protein